MCFEKVGVFLWPRGHDVVGRVLAKVGGWSDAEPPSRGGWVVGRDGYLTYRVHLGKRTQPRSKRPTKRGNTQTEGDAKTGRRKDQNISI